MFRDIINSEINTKHFGVGSIMKMGNHEQYLVCECTVPKHVTLLCLKTFTLQNKHIKVIDVNFLSQDEVRELGYILNCTLSDFDFDTKGLKK